MITVIDCIMGAGKTHFAIGEMNDPKNVYKTYLFVTPYIDEVTRIQKSTCRDMRAPNNFGKPKSEDIKRLLLCGDDVGCSHELFKRFDDETRDLIRGKHYTLILDECIEAVKPAEGFKRSDYEYLTNNNDIQTDEGGRIYWTGSNLDMRYSDIRILANNECLYKVDDAFFVWTFPHDIFDLFDDVIILTFRFKGSILQHYFDIYNIGYEIKSISKDGKSLVDFYEPDKEIYRKRFDIYGGGKNDDEYFSKYTALSSTWYKQVHNREKMNKLANSMQHFVRNILNAKSKDVQWTTYVQDEDHDRENSPKHILSRKGYANGFVPCNERATNKYRDRTVLMYCINLFQHPAIPKFFIKQGVKIDEEQIVLTALLQWIWRSNIRVSESTETIHLYIPAKRMRDIFLDWLYDNK